MPACTAAAVSIPVERPQTRVTFGPAEGWLSVEEAEELAVGFEPTT